MVSLGPELQHSSSTEKQTEAWILPCPLTAGSLTQQEKGTPQRSRLGFESVQLK